MGISQKILASILAISLMLPTMVYAKPIDKYNTPNTTTEDIDKTSPCEVTADIHYAYYVSLPASLTLEPVDFVRDAKKYAEVVNLTESELLSEDSGDYYDCWYQVKAKMKEGGLGGKYIKISPRANNESFTAYYLQEGDSQETIDRCIARGDLDSEYVNDDVDYYYVESYLQNEDTGEWIDYPSIIQKRIYFGDTASEKVVKVGSEKWYSIDGIAFAELGDQGKYKGNFEFVYGLVDSI